MSMPILHILLLLLIVAIVWCVVWVFFSFFSCRFRKDIGSMYFPSFSKDMDLMLRHLSLQSGKTLIDLWCGDGKIMRFFATHFGLCCDGIELQTFPYWYGKFLTALGGYTHIHFFRRNFLEVDISGYDYIYLYLLPQQMAEIESWIFDHMWPHALVIVNSFPFVHHLPCDTIVDAHGIPSIFLYYSPSPPLQ